jgi:hypothetical protein
MTETQKTFWKVALLTFASTIIFIIQLYTWPDAGKEKINKFSEYSFQMNFWGEEIHNEFDLIRASESYSNISLQTGEKTVSLQFFQDIEEYHYQIVSLLRVLRLQGHVAINVMQDTLPLINKVATLHGVDSIKKAKDDYEKFDQLLISYYEKVSEIEAFLPELMSTFDYKNMQLSEKEKVDLTIKQLKLLKQLYSSDNLFLINDNDPFKFIRDFATTSELVLAHYRELNSLYNERVKLEGSYKNTVILFILLLSSYFALRKDLRPN